MAKTLQIHGVPDETYEELRRRAVVRGMSISEYVRRELERSVSRPTLADTLTLAAERGGRLSFDEAVDAVRWGRQA